MIDPLAKARTHARMKAIGVKITMITLAALAVGRLKEEEEKKQKDEEIGGLIVFCQEA